MTSSEDYYQILQCQRSASFNEIKHNYQKLLLKFHPDKQVVGSKDTDDFLRIKEAWNVLSDEKLRKSYDSRLLEKELGNDMNIQEDISLADMNWEESLNCYSYPCRCGETFTLEPSDVSALSDVIVSCTGCSLGIQVKVEEQN